MAQVPISEGNRVSVQPKGNDRFRYAAPRNFVGPAIEQFGNALKGVANDINAIEATYDEADALRIANEHAAYERERLRTGENAYLTTQGFGAGEGRETAVKDIKTSAENLLGGARSDRARKMAKQALDVRVGNAEEAIGSHAVGQMNKALIGQSEARISGLTTDAVDARGTEQFAVNMGVADAELRKLGARLGWSPEETSDKAFDLRQNIHIGEVMAIDAEDGEPTAALARLDAIKQFIRPEREREVRNSLKPRVLTARFDEVVRTGGLDQYVPTPVAGDTPGTGTSAVELLRDFEGFREGTYWDVNHHRTGYGSDTITTAGGSVRKVQKGDKVSKADAERDLQRRVNDLTQTAASKSGPGWNELPEGAKAAIVSVAYNYGDASPRLVPLWQAAGEGNADKVASLIESFAGDNGGVNRSRRQQEAAAARNGVAGNPDDPRLNSATMRDAARAYAADNNLSEEETQALYAATDRTVAQGRADRAQTEDAANRRLQDWLNNNKADPDSLTSIGQIPASILAGAPPNAIEQINNRIQITQDRIQARNNAAAAERVKEAEERAVWDLQLLTDEQLATTDLSRFRGVIDLKTLGPWVERQQSIAKSGGGSVVSTDRIAGKIDSLGKSYGASRAPDASAEERQAWTALRQFVEQRVGGRPNKEVTDEDLRGIIVAGMSEVEVKGTGWFGTNVGNSTMPRAIVAPGATFRSEVPSSTKREIERNFRSRVGRDPSEDEVWISYQSGKAKGLYE